LIFRNEGEVTTPQRASFAGWLEQRELAVVEFCEGNVHRITIKLFVLFFVSHEIDFVGKSWSRAKDIAQLTRTSVRRSKNSRDSRVEWRKMKNWRDGGIADVAIRA